MPSYASLEVQPIFASAIFNSTATLAGPLEARPAVTTAALWIPGFTADTGRGKSKSCLRYFATKASRSDFEIDKVRGVHSFFMPTSKQSRVIFLPFWTTVETAPTLLQGCAACAGDESTDPEKRSAPIRPITTLLRIGLSSFFIDFPLLSRRMFTKSAFRKALLLGALENCTQSYCECQIMS